MTRKHYLLFIRDKNKQNIYNKKVINIRSKKNTGNFDVQSIHNKTGFSCGIKVWFYDLIYKTTYQIYNFSINQYDMVLYTCMSNAKHELWNIYKTEVIPISNVSRLFSLTATINKINQDRSLISWKISRLYYFCKILPKIRFNGVTSVSNFLAKNNN